MLTITIPPDELFDENTMKFIPIKRTTLQLEHSLVSVSKWESKWHKIFLDDSTEKTEEELIDYIRCMTLTQNVDPNVYYGIKPDNMQKINDYIKNPMTATHFNEENLKKMSAGRTRTDEKMSSELIYYWMISAQIPFECQKWHLNRLLTLIRICGIKNQPPKKMSKADLANKYRNVNAARRAANKH
jgi:hypothetical protein